jgi:hypothetical protein
MENNCYNTYEINIHLRNTTAWSVEQKLGVVIFPKSPQQRECISMKVLYQRGSTTPTLQYPNKKYSQKEEDETVGGLWRPTDPE